MTSELRQENNLHLEQGFLFYNCEPLHFKRVSLSEDISSHSDDMFDSDNICACMKDHYKYVNACSDYLTELEQQISDSPTTTDAENLNTSEHASKSSKDSSEVEHLFESSHYKQNVEVRNQKEVNKRRKSIDDKVIFKKKCKLFTFLKSINKPDAEFITFPSSSYLE